MESYDSERMQGQTNKTQPRKRERNVKRESQWRYAEKHEWEEPS